MPARNNRKRRSQHAQIITPGTVQIREPLYIPGPVADPHWLAVQQNGQVQVICVGGMTRLERLAGEIAAGLVSGGWSDASDVADRAVQIAEAIINKIVDRTTASQEERKDEDGESRQAPAGTPRSADPSA